MSSALAATLWLDLQRNGDQIVQHKSKTPGELIVQRTTTRHKSSSANKACQLVVSVEGFLSRADVRDLVERRREAARIRSGYYDYLPPWARPTWGVR